MKKLVLLLMAAVFPLELRAQDFEKSVAAIDGKIFPVGSDEAKAAATQFGKVLKNERDRINREDVAMWRKLAAAGDKASWEKFVQPRIEAMKKSLGSLPALEGKEVPFHITKTIPGKGFAIDNFVYESRPGLWVTANLYRPEPLPNSAPGILLIHSHHNPKTEGELQDMGVLWARAGCYVLVPDQLGHGERRQHPFTSAMSFDKPFKAGRQDYYFRYNTGMQLHLAGESLIGWMANDMVAGVTLLLKKPNIDPQRIILLGAVAGGGDPAAVTAAVDNRIQCLVPFNFGGPQPETKFPLPDDADESFNYVGGGGWESTRNLANSGADGFLPWVIVSSIAPRHLIHAHEFAWDKDRDPVWKRYQKVWSWYGAEDRVGVAHGRGSVKTRPPESTHCNNIGPEHRTPIYGYFQKWFGIPAPATEVQERLPGADLQCWTPELKAKLKPRSVHELAGELWDRRVTAEKAAARTTFTEGADGFVVKSDRSQPAGDIAVHRVLLEGKKHGLPIPTLILSPAKGTPKGVVIGVSLRGKQPFLVERKAEIAALLREGIAVALPDFVGSGEAGAFDSWGRSSGATGVSSTVRVLGGTMAAVRSDQLAQLVSFLVNDAEKAKRPTAYGIWGESFARVHDAHARTEVPFDSEPTPIVAEPALPWLGSFLAQNPTTPCHGVLDRGELISIKSALSGPFVYLPHETIDVPASPIEIGSIPASMKILIRLEAPVTGINRAVSPLPKTVGVATVQGDRNGPAEMAAWFANSLKRSASAP